MSLFCRDFDNKNKNKNKNKTSYTTDFSYVRYEIFIKYYSNAFFIFLIIFSQRLDFGFSIFRRHRSFYPKLKLRKICSVS